MGSGPPESRAGGRCRDPEGGLRLAGVSALLRVGGAVRSRQDLPGHRWNQTLGRSPSKQLTPCLRRQVSLRGRGWGEGAPEEGQGLTDPAPPPPPAHPGAPVFLAPLGVAGPFSVSSFRGDVALGWPVGGAGTSALGSEREGSAGWGAVGVDGGRLGERRTDTVLWGPESQTQRTVTSSVGFSRRLVQGEGVSRLLSQKPSVRDRMA